MAITAATNFRGIDLPEAYFRLTRLELRKDENSLTAEFQLHANDKKPGNLDYVSIQTEYVPGEDLFATAFNALKTLYKGASDV